jgi:hypothetical protein
LFVTLELSLKSPYVHPVFGPPFPRPPSPVSVVPAKEGIKNKISVGNVKTVPFNAQGLRLIIVVVLYEKGQT